MSIAGQVGVSEKLVRGICKSGLMPRTELNLATILCGYRKTIGKSYTINYFGAKYRGIIDNRDDWLVYFFGRSDVGRISFAHGSVSFLKGRTGKAFTCYDVGASRGDFSLALANTADHVVAFEQSASRHAHLLENIAASDADNILTFRVRLGDEDDVSGQQHPTAAGSVWRAEDQTNNSSCSLSLTNKRGDTLVEEANLPSPDLIRINAGAECRSVLRGFESTLEASQPIILVEQPISSVSAFADEVDLRSVLYQDATLHSLICSSYKDLYRLDPYDSKSPRIVCYPPKINRMIEQELCRLRGLRQI